MKPDFNKTMDGMQRVHDGLRGILPKETDAPIMGLGDDYEPDIVWRTIGGKTFHVYWPEVHGKIGVIVFPTSKDALDADGTCLPTFLDLEDAKLRAKRQGADVLGLADSELTLIRYWRL